MDKIETGIPGLDSVLNDGIPKGSLVLIQGPPGAGKTILATQMGFYHASKDKRVLVLTILSEAHAKLITYLEGLTYLRRDLIGNGLHILNMQKLITDEGLEATLHEIRSTVIDQNIEVLIIDSLRGLFTLTDDAAAVQSFIFSLGSALFMLGCTTLLVEDQYVRNETSPQQAIADAIFVLDAVKAGRSTMRVLEVMKLRGGNPLPGRHAFTLTTGGLEVYPRLETLPIPTEAETSSERLSFGVDGLDRLSNGGLPVGSSTLVLGSAGFGKTVLGLHFIEAGLKAGQNGLYVSFYESPEQLLAKGQQLGIDLQGHPATAYIEHLHPADVDVDVVGHRILQAVRQHSVQRLVIDSMEPIETAAAREDRFGDVLASLVRFLRARSVTTLVIRELPWSGRTATEFEGNDVYWRALDNVVLMHPVQENSSTGRAVAVLKMRNSAHDDTSFALEVTTEGLKVRHPTEGMVTP